MSDTPLVDLEQRAEYCHESAAKELEAICLQFNTSLAPNLAADIVSLVAAKELACWEGMATIEQMSAELADERDEVTVHIKTAKTAMNFALRARRYWQWQHCPLCWAWGLVLRLFGYKLDADDVERALEERDGD